MNEVLDAAQFRSGVTFAAAAIPAAAVLGLVWFAIRRNRAPLAGLALAGAGLAAMHEEFRVPDDLVRGMAALALAGVVASVLPWSDLVGAVLSIPGALMIGRVDGLQLESWLQPLVVVTIVVGGTAVASFDKRWRPGAFGTVLLPMCVAGVYLTVPDTEHLLVIVGAAIAIPILGWPLPVAAVGRAGAYATVALMMWAAAMDATGRPAAVIGAAGCLGLLVAEPLTRPLISRFRKRVRWPQLLAIAPFALIHLGSVFVASRLAGHRADPAQATVLAALAIGLAMVGLVVWAATVGLPAVDPSSRDEEAAASETGRAGAVRA